MMGLHLKIDNKSGTIVYQNGRESVAEKMTWIGYDRITRNDMELLTTKFIF
jgi:hypothetical protein